MTIFPRPSALRATFSFLSRARPPGTRSRLRGHTHTLLSVPKASRRTHSSGDSSPFLLWEPFPVYFSGSRMGVDPRRGWSASPRKVGGVHVSSEARAQQSWDLVWCPGRPVLPSSWGCRPGGLRHYPHRGHPVEGAHLAQPRRRKATPRVGRRRLPRAVV